MQTTGRTPSPPSHDSLSSSDSFLFSDSDPVEDDTDVFLSEGDASRVVRPSSRAAYSGLQGDALASPGSQWACDGFKGPEKLEVGARRPTPLSSSVSSSSTSGAWSASESEGPSEKEGPSQGDLLFTQKVENHRSFELEMLFYDTKENGIIDLDNVIEVMLCCESSVDGHFATKDLETQSKEWCSIWTQGFILYNGAPKERGRFHVQIYQLL